MHSVLADSSTDFSGTQGMQNSYYGYFPNGNVDAFTQLPVYNAQAGQWPYTTPGASPVPSSRTAEPAQLVGCALSSEAQRSICPSLSETDWGPLAAPTGWTFERCLHHSVLL